MLKSNQNRKMKKIALFSAFAVLTLVSCTKDYTCTYDDILGDEQVINYPNLDKDDVEAGEAACDILNGVWAIAE